MDIIKLATADFTRFLCFSGTDVNQCHHPSEFSHKGTGFVHHEADTLNREEYNEGGGNIKCFSPKQTTPACRPNTIFIYFIGVFFRRQITNK